MSVRLQVPELNPVYFEDLFKFHIQSDVEPRFSRDQVERFLTGLISGPENAVELWQDDKKLACAVLIDRVQNIHNSAHVEFLGVSADEEWDLPKLGVIVDYFSDLLRKRGTQTGLMISYHRSQPWPNDSYQQLGFRPFFKMFEMEKDLRFGQPSREVVVQEGYASGPVSLERFDEYYDCLVQSFARNPDTSISPKEEAREVFRKKALPTFGIEHEGKLIGFYNIRIDTKKGEGEIQTIGVLPEYRGRGLGRYLINHACHELYDRRVSKVVLSVALANASALALYSDAGFVITEEFSEFRKTITKN